MAAGQDDEGQIWTVQKRHRDDRPLARAVITSVCGRCTGDCELDGHGDTAQKSSAAGVGAPSPSFLRNSRRSLAPSSKRSGLSPEKPNMLLQLVQRRARSLTLL